MVRVPDFICVGMQKCGTTWLYEKLGQHPDIWVPAMKEIHYFNELYIPRHRDWIAADRKKVLASYLERVQGSISSAIITLDEQYRVVVCNHAAEKLLNLKDN